jgi:hypothetical protein
MVKVLSTTAMAASTKATGNKISSRAMVCSLLKMAPSTKDLSTKIAWLTAKSISDPLVPS